MADNNALNINERYELPFNISTALWNRMNDLKKEVHVQKPCKVVAVDYVNNSVDVKILDLDIDGNGAPVEYPIIPDVPIRQPLTSGSAYIILPVQINDIGTIEFFDSSVDDIITQDEYSYTLEEDWHSLSDGLFTNGFMPKSKLIPVEYNNPISIGTTDGVYTFSILPTGQMQMEGINELNMKSGIAINMDAPDISVTGNFRVASGYSGLVPTGASFVVQDGIIVNVVQP